jgi:hypothetical protein
LDLENSLQRLVPSRGPVEIDLVLKFVGGKEEWKPLNVIPVGVADEDVERQWPRLKLLKEIIAQIADSCTSVKHDDLAVNSEFHT